MPKPYKAELLCEKTLGKDIALLLSTDIFILDFELCILIRVC